MTQSSDRLDRIERMLELVVQQQQVNAAATATNNLTIAQILESQQRFDSGLNEVREINRVTAELQQQNADAINGLRQEVSASVADLIRIIDYAMEQMGEMIKNSLNPSGNGNSPHS
jgi:tRNA uridine 5-carbamoylmethylation protein Kti12